MKDIKRKETRYILKHVSGKYFKITVTAVREFTVPDTATDEQYDELKAVAIMGMNEEKITPDKVKVELIDAPDEIKAKYIINKDCQD